MRDSMLARADAWISVGGTTTSATRVEADDGDGVAVAQALDDADGGVDRAGDALALHRAGAVDDDARGSAARPARARRRR